MIVQSISRFLYDGVSQQPASLRTTNQLEECVNCAPTMAYGMTRRPPLKYLTTNPNFITDGAIYTYDRGTANEQYAFQIKDGALAIFRLSDGAEMSVSVPAEVSAYLTGITTTKDISCLTLADTTFIVNKTKVVEGVPFSDNANNSQINDYAYYWIKRTDPNYPFSYTVILNGTRVEITGAEIVAAYPNLNHRSAQNITALLVNKLNNFGVSAVNLGSVIKIALPSGWTFSSTDSWGDQASFGWRGFVRSINQLPASLDGLNHVVGIYGGTKDATTAYYVRWNGRYWQETRGVSTLSGGTFTTINQNTMPIKVVRTGYNSFSASLIDWKEPLVGDPETNSAPSFIGKNITSVFIYSNRLGFSAGSNVILSETGDYFNFYRTTVTDLLDTDPIDVAISGTQVNTIEYALSYQNRLILFSTSGQYSLQAVNDVVSPNRVFVTQISSYDYNSSIPPIIVGSSLFFCQKGTNTTIREYILSPDGVTGEAREVTAHVPNYIPSTITEFVGDSTTNTLVLRSNDTLYVCFYVKQGEQPVQNAWHTWTFKDIKALAFDSSKLYLISQKTVEATTYKTFGYIDLQERLINNNSYDVYYPSLGLIDEYESKIVLSRFYLKKDEKAIGTLGDSVQLKNIFFNTLDNTSFTVVKKNKTANSEVIEEMTNTDEKKTSVLGSNANTIIEIRNNKTNELFNVVSLDYEVLYATREK